MQTQIAAIAVDVNLLRADLRVVAKRSVATEQQVTRMPSDMDTLKASVAILKAKTRELEAQVEDAEAKLKVLHAGRSHFFQSPEAAWDWLEQNEETGKPDSLHRGSSGSPRGTAEVHTAAHRSNRRNLRKRSDFSLGPYPES
ncbi:hypothetical protein NDU88_005363 [Pleurodeles waltl]|uniref:Uncharacterized protein n=1 Tax=Pleurodeles waltl TaxID=8319 RepID=A0AAV7WUI4_PLEWA|nr:hypothetical protein NDU88_005363 [Pleurodeles waltl]